MRAPVAGDRIGLGGYLGLAVVAALNLALFRGVMQLLTIPAITALLIFLDLALTRLLIWRRPLRPSEYGFLAAGTVATLITIPYNNDPRILQEIIDLYRDVTGDVRTFRFNHTASFIYAERVALGIAILAIALGGGALAGWGRRRQRRRMDGADPGTSRTDAPESVRPGSW